MSNLFQLLLSKHPSSHLQIFWNIWLINFTIFPIFPTWGSLGMSVVGLIIFKQQYKHIISQKFNKIIGIFSLLLFFLSCFAYKPEESFLGLHNFLLYFLAFICFSILIQTPLQLIKIADNLLIGSIPVIILGLGQMFLNWQTPDFLIPLFGWKLDLLGNPIGRMSSVFMYANILAVYLIIVFALGLGLLFINFQQPKKRLYYLILLIFIAIAIILTNSRNAWIIMILTCLIWAIYQKWYWLLGIFTAISSIILTAAFAPISIAEICRKIVPKFIWARLNDQLYPDRQTETLRVTQWQFIWKMAQDRPLTGWGLRNFSFLYQEKTNIWLGHPHNLFLMLAGEMGIPATIFFCAIIGFILAKTILLLKQVTGEERLILFSYLVAFTGCILFNLADVSMFDFRANVLGWILLAGMWGCVKNGQLRIEN